MRYSDRKFQRREYGDNNSSFAGSCYINTNNRHFFQNKKEQRKVSEVTEPLIKNINNEKEIFLQMENNLALKSKNTLLEGLQEVNKNLSANNENLLIKFGSFSQNLTNTSAENNRLLTKDINIFKDEFKSSMNKDFEQLNQK